MVLHALANHWFFCYDYISLSYNLTARKQGKKCKRWEQKDPETNNELHNIFFSAVLAESKFKNHLINLTHGCLHSDSVDNYAKGMFWFWFLIFVQHVASLFAVATGTTISCSLGRQYGPVFSLSFLNIYGIAIYLVRI